MPLTFVKHNDIDFAKWDKALSQCYNENPYAYSHWLNLVSEQWCALINDDYTVLVPLPVKRKLGISYIAQPCFTQQLGVFSITPLEGDLLKSYFNKIPKHFLKVYIQLNTENYIPMPELRHRITYCLALKAPYEELYANFNPHHKRNINKALEICRQKNLVVTISKDYKAFIENFRNTVGLKDDSLTKKDYDLMFRIISSSLGKIIICATKEGEILSGLFYLESRTKIVNLFNFTTSQGREDKAMYLILNNWIKEYSNQDKSLDFEGSEIKSIAKFYNGFGALAKNYQIFTKKGFWQM
jgi:hypothetical protein